MHESVAIIIQYTQEAQMGQQALVAFKPKITEKLWLALFFAKHDTFLEMGDVGLPVEDVVALQTKNLNKRLQQFNTTDVIEKHKQILTLDGNLSKSFANDIETSASNPMLNLIYSNPVEWFKNECLDFEIIPDINKTPVQDGAYLLRGNNQYALSSIIASYIERSKSGFSWWEHYVLTEGYYANMGFRVTLHKELYDYASKIGEKELAVATLINIMVIWNAFTPETRTSALKQHILEGKLSFKKWDAKL
jgi:hypothetical protein